jgi:hypothetical protein
MRLMLRIGFFGIALVTAVATLGGCGGGSNHATARLQGLGHYRCQVAGVKDQLRALEAGISWTKREFEGTNPRPTRQQILRSMEENSRLIHAELPRLELCAQNALREAEGKPVHEPSLPPEPTVVGHRLGPPRVEPGVHALPASPCQAYGKNGTTTIYIYPDSPGCARVAPGERLRVANDTGIGGPTGAVGVRVLVGDYETYLGRGTHGVRAVGGIGPTVLLLPSRGCAIRPPAKPGEELCFR